MQTPQTERRSSLGDKVIQRLRAVPGIKGLRSRARDELEFFRSIYRRGLWKELLRRPQSHLQQRRVQQSAVYATTLPATKAESFEKQLRALGVKVFQDGDSLYIAPQEDLAGKFGTFISNYPDDAGFRIWRRAREAREATTAAKSSTLLEVGNFLQESGLGPRIYDSALLKSGEETFDMLVAQHLSGTVPTVEERREFTKNLREIMKQEQLLSRGPDLDQDPDFTSPDSNQKLIRCSKTNRVYFMDPRKFYFHDYDLHLQRKLKEAAGIVHIGRRHLLRGGRYLYQQVPGVAATGKRGTRHRWVRIRSLLADNGLKVQDRLILDIACNTGMMLAEALNDGARWGLGWDMPKVAEQGRSLLWALGYSRFELNGRVLAKDSPLPNDVPPHLKPLLSRSILFYLAIRHHIGFIDAVKNLPWEAMVYEGGADEAGEALERIIQDLQTKVPCKIIRAERIDDGDTASRPLLLFLRSH